MLVGLVSELVDWILEGILIFFVVLRAERACFGGKISRTVGRRRAYGCGFVEELLFLVLIAWCC